MGGGAPEIVPATVSVSREWVGLTLTWKQFPSPHRWEQTQAQVPAMMLTSHSPGPLPPDSGQGWGSFLGQELMGHSGSEHGTGESQALGLQQGQVRDASC